ncbi:recombinase family protein [Faecalicoccus acidiformans]|uniref:recombinase family protein n=1 Tax=Faecalicoccus acidiformans TaxID=915173 RepID=UPI00320936E3
MDKKIAIYVRVSSRDQAINGFGLDAQEAKCRQYLDLYDKDPNSIVLYKEKGISGKSTNRPQMQEMMKDVKENKISMIIVYKLDRLTRSVIDTYKLLYELQEHNCQLIAVIDQLDINSANGRMIVGILAVFAQWEREVIQERTLDGLQAMVNQGKYPYAHSPFGWNKDQDKFLSVNEFEANVINDLADHVLDGMSLLESKTYLFSKYGIRKHEETIKKWLTRAMNSGVFQYHGKDYLDIFPAIMSEEKRISIIDSIKEHKKPEKDQYYFYGRIYCTRGHKCIQVVTNKNNSNSVDKYYYYYCKECKKRINQETILKQILPQILSYKNDEIKSKEGKVKINLLKNIRRAIDQTYESYSSGLIDFAKYIETLTVLKKKLARVSNQISGLKIKTFESFRKSSATEKRSLVESSIDKIIIDMNLKLVIKIIWK